MASWRISQELQHNQCQTVYDWKSQKETNQAKPQLSLPTRTHRKTEKPRFDCGRAHTERQKNLVSTVAIRSRKVAKPLSKPSEIYAKQKGTDEMKESPHSETGTIHTVIKKRRIQTSQLNSQGLVAHVPSSFIFSHHIPSPFVSQPIEQIATLTVLLKQFIPVFPFLHLDVKMCRIFNRSMHFFPQLPDGQIVILVIIAPISGRPRQYSGRSCLCSGASQFVLHVHDACLADFGSFRPSSCS